MELAPNFDSKDQSPVSIRFFDDDAVVFNARSGETHLLQLPAARVLRAIISGCSDVRDLERLLEGGREDPIAIEAHDVVLNAISEFSHLGLIDGEQLEALS